MVWHGTPYPYMPVLETQVMDIDSQIFFQQTQNEDSIRLNLFFVVVTNSRDHLLWENIRCFHSQLSVFFMTFSLKRKVLTRFWCAVSLNLTVMFYLEAGFGQHHSLMKYVTCSAVSCYHAVLFQWLEIVWHTYTEHILYIIHLHLYIHIHIHIHTHIYIHIHICI